MLQRRAARSTWRQRWRFARFTSRVAPLLCLTLLALFSANARADVLRPAYLELREAGGDRYDVLFRVPALSETEALALDVEFPEGTHETRAPRGVFSGDALVRRWQVQRAGGFVGRAVRVEGAAARATDVIARLEREDGTSQVERLGLEHPQFVVQAAQGTSEIAGSYLVLGVEHILSGVDHLLFVLALLLIVRGGRRIFATITAFTLAHSLTLVSAALGWVRVPGPPVEAVIALSIVFVAAEVVHGRRGSAGLTARAPWVVAFGFGLLHGFGFASALAEVGLPQRAIPMALFMFNVGVELGQLAFVLAALGVAFVGKRLMRRQSAAFVPTVVEAAAPYAIGATAMFWVVERVTAFWE